MITLFLFEKKKALPRSTFIRRWPFNFLELHRKHFEKNLIYHCPEIIIYKFKSVSLLPDGTLFLFRLFPLSCSFLYYRGRIRIHSIKGILAIQNSWTLKKLHTADRPYVIIHDQWTFNYYHWMTQALPRLLLVKQTNNQFILLLPKNYTKSFHIESLRALDVTEWISIETDNTYYQVRNLIYPAHDIQVGDYNEIMIRKLADILKTGLRSTNRRSYIFVHRESKKGRRILNEEETLNTFISHGFEIVLFEELSFDEQRQIAHGASVLAGVHGAGLTNMLYMNSGSVFELTSEVKGEQYYFYTLSNALDHKYYYQHCEHTGGTIQEADIIVDIEVLHHNLKLILGK